MLLIENESLLLRRPRRNRRTDAIRALVQENHLLASDLIAPFFVVDGENTQQTISSLPGIYRLSIDNLLRQIGPLCSRGLQAVALFPWIPKEKKDNEGSYALQEDSLIPNAIKAIKREFPDLCVVGDIALDPYTSHGHDGLLGEDGNVKNDETVRILSDMSLLYASCGADMVAPSDMMDGRVQAIRRALDLSGYQHVSILSYTAKYASSLYAPYREAVGSILKIGDKKNYQLNPANSEEALLEAMLDEEEGADILMVKPALFYLDIIAKIKEKTHLPVCAFHVTGEYAMVMAAEEKGFLDGKKVFFESLLSIKRAGASMIISWATPLILKNLHSF